MLSYLLSISSKLRQDDGVSGTNGLCQNVNCLRSTRKMVTDEGKQQYIGWHYFPIWRCSRWWSGDLSYRSTPARRSSDCMGSNQNRYNKLNKNKLFLKLLSPLSRQICGINKTKLFLYLQDVLYCLTALNWMNLIDMKHRIYGQ